MGYLFEHQDKAVWSPSRVVAELFLTEVRYVEGRLAVPSGLTEYMSDTIEIDFEALSRYLQALRKWLNLENNSVRMLIRGVVVHLLALLVCGDGLADEVAHIYPEDWVDEARSLARSNMISAETTSP
jgi:hypothetical protein